MKRRLYFRNAVGAVTFFPRALLFVFLREKFGERYMGWTTVAIPGFFLAVVPLFEWGMLYLAGRLGAAASWQVWAWSIYSYLGWYVFTVLFIRRGLRHYRESRPPAPNTYNFSRYSYFEGYINPLFYKASRIKIFGQTLCDKEPTIRDIETYLEPLVGFLLATALILLQQKIGQVLLICSWLYCIRFVSAYDLGHHHTLSIIDDMISSEEMQRSFGGGTAGQEDTFLTEDDMQGYFANLNKPRDKVFSVLDRTVF